MITPTIRISNGWLLNADVIPLLLPRLKEEGRENEATKEFIAQRVEDYKNALQPYESKILNGMCDALGLEFVQNAIDVYIVPFHHSFSDPMVISTKYEPDRFIDVFIHELSHRLLTDNTKKPKEWEGLMAVWKELFGDDHEWNTLIHIPVHLIMKYIFLDVMDEPKRLERDIVRMKPYPLYSHAWDYVEANDYRKLLRNLNDSYDTLSTTSKI